MISHSEATEIWLGAFGLAAFIGGLLSGHWWWPLRQRLDEEWDDGYGHAVTDACQRVEDRGEVLRLSPGGQARWCDAGSQWDIDGARRALSFDDDDGEPQSSFKNVPRPGGDAGRAEASGLATMPDADAGPGHLERPAGPSPAAGRTYSELVMLAAQDIPEPLGEVEPVDWYPDALRRSEDWLEACRAELGLVAS